jgi:hypothetical protein
MPEIEFGMTIPAKPFDFRLSAGGFYDVIIGGMFGRQNRNRNFWFGKTAKDRIPERLRIFRRALGESLPESRMMENLKYGLMRGCRK